MSKRNNQLVTHVRTQGCCLLCVCAKGRHHNKLCLVCPSLFLFENCERQDPNLFGIHLLKVYNGHRRQQNREPHQAG